MIAKLLDGKTGTNERSSVFSIDLIDTGVPTSPDVQKNGDLNIDGGVGLSRARRASLPVVMFPAMREYGQILQDSADELFKLQQSSLGFRVVALTDMRNFKSLRPYGWALSHVPAEASWDVDDLRWEAYFKSETIRTVQNFGVTHWAHLGLEGILDGAWRQLLDIAKLEVTRPALSEGGTESRATRHYSWRGWLSTVPEGSTEHEVLLESEAWKVEVNRRISSSMVLVHVGESTPEYREMKRAALASEWTVVHLSCTEEVRNVKLEELGVRAIFDAYSFAWAGILSSDREDQRYLGLTPRALLTKPKTIGAAVAEAERRALAYWTIS